MSRQLAVVAWLAVLAAAACTDDLDPPWQLDHDRIVAIRATPPAVTTGERSRIDGLIAVAGSTTIEVVPALATVVSPPVLAGALTKDGDDWIVTGPDPSLLAVARAELGLEASAPVPLQIGVSFADDTLLGLKIVELGASRANPQLPPPTIDGVLAPPGSSELVVAKLVDVPLSVEVTEADEVNWLTSCGTMHDFDLPAAYLRVEPDDPVAGELVLVVRDELGGVVWERWPIRAE